MPCLYLAEKPNDNQQVALWEGNQPKESEELRWPAIQARTEGLSTRRSAWHWDYAVPSLSWTQPVWTLTSISGLLLFLGSTGFSYDVPLLIRTFFRNANLRLRSKCAGYRALLLKWFWVSLVWSIVCRHSFKLVEYSFISKYLGGVSWFYPYIFHTYVFTAPNFTSSTNWFKKHQW